MGLTAVVPVPHTVIHNRPTPGWGTGRATLVHRVNEPQRLGVTLATNYKPPSLRYPAISVATLPTRWSADADPLPHLRLGPRIQTPWTPVLFAPACQCTTSRFICPNASDLLHGTVGKPLATRQELFSRTPLQPAKTGLLDGRAVIYSNPVDVMPERTYGTERYSRSEEHTSEL